MNSDHIHFLNQDKKTWKEYVSRKVLEITCGEAPFLVSRYDSSTGNSIEIQDRVGLFDRKLRVVTENTNNFKDWYKWALKALKSTYGYEFQGDSLLIGRVNVYLTLLENAKEIWDQDLTVKQQEQIADIICWNLFQMDGLTDCIPVGAPADQFVQASLFDFFETEQTNDETTSPPVIINWWDGKTKIKMREMKEGNKMSKAKRWGVIIGNPPYQESDGGNGRSAKPVYQLFVEEAKKLNSDILSFIIPARWYAGGKGLNNFRNDMLNDVHLRELVDFENFRDIFPGVDLAGGACFFIRDENYTGQCTVKTFSSNGYSELKRNLNEFETLIRSNQSVEILRKIKEQHKEKYLDSVVSARKPFSLPTNYSPLNSGIPCQFLQKIGLKYANPSDVKDPNHILDKWKLLIPRAPIAGQTDFSRPVGFYSSSNTFIVPPGTCCTESYLVAFASDTKEEVESFRSYLFTKVVRFLLLQSVVSQDVTREKFRYVPDLGHYEGVYTDLKLQEMWKLNDSDMTFINQKISETN